MKLSLFNVSKEYESKTYWVYNTLTTAAVVLEESAYNRYFVTEDFDYQNSDVLELKEMGFIVEDDFDEIEYLKYLRGKVIESNKPIVDIMIAPTMDCNAHCYYCFERGCHHEKMSRDTADAVVAYISENWDHELFNVTWFGGEPLLATDIISYISERMRQKGINFVSRITTNGFELTPPIIDKAKKQWHTTEVQISVDALFEEYDRIKAFSTCDDSSAFVRVIGNIRSALEAGLKIRVRINFNPLEQYKAFDLMQYLQDQFGKYTNFIAYFAPIDYKTDVVPSIASKFENLSEHPFLSMIKFSQKFGYFSGNERGKESNFLYDDNGMLASLKLYPSPTNCYASCPNVFSIDSKGDLYKCHRILGKGEKYSSGNVNTGIIKNEIYDFFCNTNPVLDECETCKLFPICQGGCKINYYLYGDNHACSPIKAILPDVIELYLKMINAI